MANEEFEKRLESLKTPAVDDVRHQHSVKLAILSARKSAAVGVWLILIPSFFLLSVCMKYYFMQNWHFIDTFEEILAALDKSSGTWFVGPLLLVGFPMLAFVLNFLSILHFELDSAARELRMTVRLRWFNLLLLSASAMIIGVFILYVITENIRHVM